MPVFRLGVQLVFPPVKHAEKGLLAIGGDLSPDRLVLAYSSGIFPWYEEGQPILWHSPDPRMVLSCAKLKVPRSLRKVMRRGPYDLTMDLAFPEVITACGSVKRRGEKGTWITAAMKEAYGELHRRGLAHSVEAWQAGQLVGGLYGVSLGGVFFGESMFAKAPDASKIALVALVQQLITWGIRLVDCQVYTDHLARFGAEEWPRDRYLKYLKGALAQQTRSGKWAFEPETKVVSHGLR